MEYIEATIKPKFQITLPKKVREALGITGKTSVVFQIENNVVHVMHKSTYLINAMDDLVRAGPKTPDILEKLKKSRQEW